MNLNEIRAEELENEAKKLEAEARSLRAEASRIRFAHGYEILRDLQNAAAKANR